MGPLYMKSASACMCDFLCVEMGLDAYSSAFVGHCIFMYIGVRVQAVRIIVFFKDREVNCQSTTLKWSESVIRAVCRIFWINSGFLTRYAAS